MLASICSLHLLSQCHFRLWSDGHTLRGCWVTDISASTWTWITGTLSAFCSNHHILVEEKIKINLVNAARFLTNILNVWATYVHKSHFQHLLPTCACAWQRESAFRVLQMWLWQKCEWKERRILLLSQITEQKVWLQMKLGWNKALNKSSDEQ